MRAKAVGGAVESFTPGEIFERDRWTCQLCFVVAETQLDVETVVEAPRLPGSTRMLAATRDWYATWCRSPQAAQFIGTDWLRLHMLARLVDRFYRSELALEQKQLMSEIRLNEQKLGGTPEDRLRLRWRLVEGERGDQEEKPKARSRRKRDPRLTVLRGGDGAA